MFLPGRMNVFRVPLMQGPMKLMNDGYKRHGEVFTVPVLHKNFTFLLGPHVSGHFFKANDDEMSQKEVCFALPSLHRLCRAMSLLSGSVCPASCLLCRCTSSMCQHLARGLCLMWTTRWDHVLHCSYLMLWQSNRHILSQDLAFSEQRFMQ